MKLIGSKTEHELGKQLLKSKQALFENEENRRLLAILKSSCPGMKTACILHWIPEQGEDIYEILVDDYIIAEVEIDRYDSKKEPIIKTKPIAQYLHGLGKQDQIKLAVALDLAKQDMKGGGHEFTKEQQQEIEVQGDCIRNLGDL